ncbi:unnamed protein product [Calicophoron daubneyi]|uniref:FAD-binding domain-containing protein n=1 Tax=Calicophoron daubneyi TaxID=300641 RepID=A0AAV2TDY0_CALDB
MNSRLGWLIPRLSVRLCAAALSSTSSYDIVVVGGGMVGNGLAALSGTSNVLRHKRLLLLESTPKKEFILQEQYQTRTVALNETSRKLLQELGAWDFIEAQRVQPVYEMKVWETQSDAFLTFKRNPIAHIAENNLVAEALRLAAVARSKNLTIAHGAVVEDISLPSSKCPDQLVKIRVRFRENDDVQDFETKLLIGADGVRSKVREVSGIHTVSWDHGQSAIVAIPHMGEGNEEHVAWQRFLPTGPLALLPLSSQYSCLIWSTTNSEAARLMTLSEADFVAELNDALTRTHVPTTPIASGLRSLGQNVMTFLDSVVGKSDAAAVPASLPTPPVIKGLQTGTKRSVWPLGFHHATCYHAPRVALAGDAAHRILPLAGQGVNLGFGDVISLVKYLEEAVSEGGDLGNTMYLSRYTSERERDVVPFAAAMEIINALYSTEALALKFGAPTKKTWSDAIERPSSLDKGVRLLASLRAIGVGAVQSSALLKSLFLQTAVSGHVGLPGFDCRSAD